MALPVRTVTRPACLTGQTNGKLDASILDTIDGQAGGPDVRLVAPAARAWRALTAAALAAGHVLKASGPYDSFRPYDVQERIFRARYTTIPNGTTPRYWNGRRWYKRPGVAAAAVPGTSNHGWGLAVDVGEERDGDTGTESIDAGTVGWLVANEHRFGWSHEIQSEPWHIRYFAGDRVPADVPAHQTPAPPGEDVFTMAAHDRLDGQKALARQLFRTYLCRNPNNQTELDVHVLALAREGYENRVVAFSESAEGKAVLAAERRAAGL